MVSFPNAKINLGLNIIRKRKDGFHDLQSCFLPIGWNDILEIIPATETTFKSTGLTIPGDPESNLCLKAYQLLAKDFTLPSVSIHLHKIIPIGAGLGGGSSDAAFTIKMLNEMADLGLNDGNLENYARELGSDCTFFIKNIPAFATEKGDKLESMDPGLHGKYLLVIYPEIHISTAMAYQGITPNESNSYLKNILEEQKATEWKKLVKNDFENHILKNFPQIQALKDDLYAHGAIYASMSGSGSSVFGIFDSPVNLPQKYNTLSHWSGLL